MLHEILNMGWPSAMVFIVIVVAFTANWNIRRMAKLDAASREPVPLHPEHG